MLQGIFYRFSDGVDVGHVAVRIAVAEVNPRTLVPRAYPGTWVRLG